MPIDPKDKIQLSQSTVTDTEAQFSGDVETKYVELREQAAAPSAPTDKASALLYSLTDHTVRVKNSLGAVLNLSAGLATDVMDAVIAVADAPGGATDAACTVQVNDLAGSASTKVCEVLILAQSTQYAGMHAIQAHVTFGTATVGSILATGSGWAVVKTSATGAFACTATNASDETVYFSVATATGGHDALAAGTVIRGCVPDRAIWSA